MDFEKLAEEISGRVRDAVAEAEEQARKIVAEAESEAAKIRARAENDARSQLADVRSALDRLESSITGEQAAVVAEAKAEIDADVSEPDVEPAPEPDQPDEDAEGDDADADDPDQDLAGEEELPEAEVTGEGDGLDEAGARLVAMEMALDGEDVEAISTRLTEEFGLVNANELASEVHTRAAP